MATVGRWIFRDGKMMTAREYYASQTRVARSETVAAPMVIKDTFSKPIFNHVTCRYYDSRSDYMADLKEEGIKRDTKFEILGNDPCTQPKEMEPWKPDPNEVRQDVKDTIDKLEAKL